MREKYLLPSLLGSLDLQMEYLNYQLELVIVYHILLTQLLFVARVLLSLLIVPALFALFASRCDTIVFLFSVDKMVSCSRL